MTDKYVPFSMRSGRRTIPQLGLQDMPKELRISLWNVIEPWIWNTYGYDTSHYDRKVQWVYNFHTMRWPTHETPSYGGSHNATKRLHDWFLTRPADDIYDFIEALPQIVFAGYNVQPWDYATLNGRDTSQTRHVMDIISQYQRNANAMLEREGSPYRIVDNLIVPITNQTEITEVQAAIGTQDRFSAARDHIAEGLKHLGARPPAYADCIKQAVSAVESALKIAVGQDGKMAQLLAGFEKKYGELHPALRAAIDKVYGYASDEDGVRHGAAEAVTVGEPEARALLVTCSALTNFLIRNTVKQT